MPIQIFFQRIIIDSMYKQKSTFIQFHKKRSKMTYKLRSNKCNRIKRDSNSIFG